MRVCVGQVERFLLEPLVPSNPALAIRSLSPTIADAVTATIRVFLSPGCFLIVVATS